LKNPLLFIKKPWQAILKNKCKAGAKSFAPALKHEKLSSALFLFI